MVKRIEWTPALVNKFWDGVAQTDLDNLSFGKVAGPQFIELIGNYLLQGHSYLDFGAGSGHVMQLLLDRGLSVAGFDPSPDRQALLLEKIGNHKNFLGVKGADSDEQFDVVILMEVVEHVLDEDFSSVLARVSRFVKPGGYLVVSTPNNENLETSSVYCPVSDTLFHPWQHVRSFTPSQLEKCFKSIGFSTDFVALADFSCDAELIEKYKNNEAINAEKVYKQSAIALHKLIEEYEIKLMEFGLVEEGERNKRSLGIWRKIKLGLEILQSNRAHIARLRALSSDMSHRFDAIYDCVGGQMSQTRVVDDGTDMNGLRPDGKIDLRLGRETTIVYVGKKNVV